MTQVAFDADSLQSCVTRYAAGDDSALNELLSRTSARLEQLTRAMFRDFARVHRWEETADVLQSASIRLCRALQATRPTDVRGVFTFGDIDSRVVQLGILARWVRSTRNLLVATHDQGNPSRSFERPLRHLLWL